MWEVFKTRQNKWNEINSKGNCLTQNLVRVRGNEMDVQHPRRWQNSDVAFLMDSALFKGKSGAGVGGSGGKTRFVFDCVGLQRRQDTYCTREGISPLLFCDWIKCSNQHAPQVTQSQHATAAEIPSLLLTNRIKRRGWSFLLMLFVFCFSLMSPVLSAM